MNSRPMDWSAPRFLPVRLESNRRRVIVSAGGASITFDGELFRADADGPLTGQVNIGKPFSTEQGEFAVLSLNLTAEQDTVLRELTWFAGEWAPGPERFVASTGLQDNVLFLRTGGVSFFLSLDFPFSRITRDGIRYPAQETIRAGHTHACHSLSVGACRLSGQTVGDLDRAEIEAVSAYVEQRHPPRFERPMHISCGITNRMTECREGRVFYSLYDNPTIALNPGLIREDIRLMARLGIEYIQLFEGSFDWPDERRTGANLRRLTTLSRRLGVRLGDYVNPQGLYCPHYNYSSRNVNRPEWLQRNADGTAGSYCLGCRDYVESFRERLIEHNRRYGMEMICFDFLDIRPCHASNHGHPPGDVYQSLKALLSIFEALNGLSPEYMVWSNSGNWNEFLPKLAWWNPNIYVTDPHVREYSPTLNALKFLGDGRREQMVTLHERHFVPYRVFTNCEYYAFPRSREPDLRVFEYSFLQGLAVTPNICPAETRVFLNRVPSAHRDRCVRFMRKWMAFTRTHFDVWKRTARVGDAPGMGATEIYAHIAGTRGYVCLVNQNPFPRVARFRLDGTIGLSGGERFVIREIYPRECPIAEQALPWSAFGEEIVASLPAYGVRYLAIAPFDHSATTRPIVFGLPAGIRKTRGGYRLRLKAPQGETVRLGVSFPAGEGLDSVSVRPTPTVPMYTFPATAAVTAREGNTAWIEVTFPRERAPEALTHWRVTPGGLDMELPRLGECGFLGARVSGAFREDYPVQVDLRTAPAKNIARLAPIPPPLPVSAAPLPPASAQTFETEFDLPFIEPAAYGCMPGYEDDTLIELAFRDPGAVAALAVRLNGQPVEARRYPYPRKKEWFTWYVELTGTIDPGRIKLAVDVTWKKA